MYIKIFQVNRNLVTVCSRYFHSSLLLNLKAVNLPSRPKVNENEIEEVFIKGGGNGGQKINKTNSKVQLTHIPTGMVVSSQATRSREQNRKHARELLALKLQELENPETSRSKILKDYKKQQKRSKTKKSKKKYQLLEQEKQKEKKDETLLDTPAVIFDL